MKALAPNAAAYRLGKCVRSRASAKSCRADPQATNRSRASRYTPPSNLDWARYLGIGEVSRLRAFLDFGGGKLTDFGAHWIDVVHMFLGLHAAALRALSNSRALGANDRVQLGVIGSGSRGQYVMTLFQKTGQADVRAVCDA